MRKIYITLIILLASMIAMAYVYFAKLNKDSSYNEISLYAATANSGLVFSLQNDKSVFDILKGQDLFENLMGQAKFNQLSLLKTKLFVSPALQHLVNGSNIFLSFSAGKNKETDYLICTQFNETGEKPMLAEALKSSGIQTSTEHGIQKFSLNDSTVFYLGTEKNLILLSNAANPVIAALASSRKNQQQEFVNYIKSHHNHSKNSLGNLFIDFSRLPELLKAVVPALNGNADVLARQQSFAALNYNFSKERVYFNGNTKVNDPKNYLSLFTTQAAQKNTLDNLLPEQTANFILYTIPDYKRWRKTLQNWFALRKEDKQVSQLLKSTAAEYHLDPEEIFPGYFKDQLITFQLRSGENIGAINLSNGDKVAQLLLDLSSPYSEDIKVFKKSGLLYSYFGQPFKMFSKPYYTIIDNYMVFSNQPLALQNFLSAYRNNKLLIGTADYTNLYSQISANSSVTYYVNHQNSTDLVRRSVYRPYYIHFTAGKGLKRFSSFIYQLSSDQGSFQTNLLMNTPQQPADEDLTNK